MLKRNGANSGIRKYAAPSKTQTQAESEKRLTLRTSLGPPRRAPLEGHVDQHHQREHDEHAERERLGLVRVRDDVAADVDPDLDRDEADRTASQPVGRRVGGEGVPEEED